MMKQKMGIEPPEVLTMEYPSLGCQALCYDKEPALISDH